MKNNVFLVANVLLCAAKPAAMMLSLVKLIKLPESLLE